MGKYLVILVVNLLLILSFLFYQQPDFVPGENESVRLGVVLADVYQVRVFSESKNPNFRVIVQETLTGPDGSSEVLEPVIATLPYEVNIDATYQVSLIITAKDKANRLRGVAIHDQGHVSEILMTGEGVDFAFNTRSLVRQK